MTQGTTKKKLKQKKMSEYLAFVILLIVLIIVLKATWNLAEKNQQALANLYDSNERLGKLISRQTVLQNKIEQLKTDRGVEEEIRNNFSVVKEGERVINLMEKNGSSSAPAIVNPKWWQIF